MDIKPKFDIGDQVFCARVIWGETSVECPDCLGTAEWKVTCPSGEEFKVRCNTCVSGYYSSGKVKIYKDQEYIKILTVGSIRIDTNEKARPVSYMCVETGIGSGSIYYEENLFKTIEDAKAWAAKELERVKGVRQEQELAARKRKKGETVYYYGAAYCKKCRELR